MKRDINPTYNLLRASGSIVIPKSLIAAIGYNEAIIFSELLSRYEYFNIREELDEEGYFYNTVIDLESGTMLGKTAQNNAIKRLVTLGLIKYKLKGMPSKRHFMIVDDVELLNKLLLEGKQKIDELEKRRLEEQEISVQKRRDRQEEHRQTVENRQLACNERTSWNGASEQVGSQHDGNNTNLNNTNLNNTDREGAKVVAFHTMSKMNEYLDSVYELIDSREFNNGDDICEVFRYYFFQYREWEKVAHKPYTKKQTIKMVHKLDDILTGGIELDTHSEAIYLDDIKNMIDRHFEMEYDKINHELAGFLSDGILKYRYLETRNNGREQEEG